MDRPVVVMGLMAAGKSSVGRRLAARLGRPFLDSDEELAAFYGESAAEQVARHGVEVLHRREAELLRRALAGGPPPVVAPAASVVDDPDCRARLAGAYVVWLHAPPEVLADRLTGGDHRPHYHPDPVVMLTSQYERRAGRFREVADLVVEVTDRTPDEVVAIVLAALPA